MLPTPYKESQIATWIERSIASAICQLLTDVTKAASLGSIFRFQISGMGELPLEWLAP